MSALTTTLNGRRVKIVPVVTQCHHCGRYYHLAVQFDGDAPSVMIPDNCVRCGEPLDTPEHHAMLHDTARALLTAPKAWSVVR